ncbi:MAG: hypothetical protein HWN66_09340 [Candidatus Helarchaeota archaeon]|nr:hypothetical protein [Candidatus Helarchaeota archaeon]
MSKLNAVETIESQERMIKKQNREIKKLEREVVSVQDEFFNFKKGQKLKLLEIQKRIKEQSYTIKDLKMQKKVKTRQFEEKHLKQQEKEQTAESKIRELQNKNEILIIENEELTNKITEDNVKNLERDTEISNLKTQIKELEDKIEHIKQTEINELQQKLLVKGDLLEKQTQAVNQLTLDMKKYEVEIAELEYKLSNEQGKHSELGELQKKVGNQEEIIIHLRKTNISNKEKIKSLRDQLNGSNKRINELLQKLKEIPGNEARSGQEITYFQINFPEND